MVRSAYSCWTGWHSFTARILRRSAARDSRQADFALQPRAIRSRVNPGTILGAPAARISAWTFLRRKCVPSESPRLSTKSRNRSSRKSSGRPSGSHISKVPVALCTTGLLKSRWLPEPMLITIAAIVGLTIQFLRLDRGTTERTRISNRVLSGFTSGDAG